MSDFNEELLCEINALRTNTKKYARTIPKYINYFKDKLYYLNFKKLVNVKKIRDPQPKFFFATGGAFI